LFKKLLEKHSLGRPKRYEDNIKIELYEICCEDERQMKL
jgi:hypothetical protein